jgi:putative membrane-bound dehydrogenase-like protein
VSTSRRTSLAAWLASGVLLGLVFPRAQGTTPGASHGLSVPPGFEVERVAGPPLVNRPIVADFDEEGRLYVADSSGSNDKVEQQLAERPHRIVRLEDTDDDGRFDRSVVFADRMMLPEGTMWFEGSLYVAAPPSIWKLTDTDGDGVADRREEWFRGQTLTGCANDLHGPYPGPDGWIYWTKGAFAEQTYERPGRPALVTRAAHIFRRRPGDHAIDVVMTGGMDNPVDVAFTPSGERILSATFLEHPQAGRRDALVHAIYGGVYGKPHAVLDGHPRTGDLMPVMCQLGPAVPAGLTRYGSRAFGDDYRDTFFAAMFNLRKVTRHVLEPDGATFRTRDSDFVVSEDRDFHPTDVIEDADGSLLVVDTGPWYKLCCPTSQIARPEVFGAIYRVRQTKAASPDDPRGRRLGWHGMSPTGLAALLDDPRPAVVERALRQLAKAGAAAVPALEMVLASSPSVDARRNAVWALTRIDGNAARQGSRPALDDVDRSVRQAAIHSAALWRDRGALPQLLSALRSAEPPVQRAAAEALGRLSDARAVPQLVAAAATSRDRVLEHSLTYALIEIGDVAATETAAADAGASSSRRAALIALDQIGRGLTPDRVVPLLDSGDTVLASTAWWIAARHPEWGGALAGYFDRQLASADDRDAARGDLSHKLAVFAGSRAVQQLLADHASNAARAGAAMVALQAMSIATSSAVPAGVRLKELPASWPAAVARALQSQDPEVVARALAVARAAPAPEPGAAGLSGALRRLVRNRRAGVETRLAALAALVSAGDVVDTPGFDLLRSALEPGSPAPQRMAAAAVLEKSKLDSDRLRLLVPAVETAGPLELPRILRAFEQGTGEQVGLALIAALDRSKARATLRADTLRPRIANYPEAVKAAAERLLASVNAEGGNEARLEKLLGEVGGGDVARGRTVFNSARAACLSCHAIGYIGGRIGPDLTKIGQVRGERDLLEAVVFPSASFARGYEPVEIRTRSGEVHAGLLRTDGADEVVVGSAAGTDTHVPRRNVAAIEPGTISLMPSGYADLLTRQELADLLAFLKAAR